MSRDALVTQHDRRGLADTVVSDRSEAQTPAARSRTSIVLLSGDGGVLDTGWIEQQDIQYRPDH